MSNYDHDGVLNHWQSDRAESMYDKHLLQAEIDLIRRHLASHSKVLDAGCGEGEGTFAYASFPGVVIHGADFSETRLQKAQERVKNCSNVTLKHVDFTGSCQLDNDYDFIISQRFLINITDWGIQKKTLEKLMALLKPKGQLLLLEGCLQGANALNLFRKQWGLPPIPIQWHNLFFDDEKLISFMTSCGFQLKSEDGLGAYFLLTRGIRPALQSDLHWNCEFNRVASLDSTKEMLPFGDRYSRLKLWCFQKSF